MSKHAPGRPPRFTKQMITKAKAELPEHDRERVLVAARSVKKISPHIGATMALSIVAHLGAWLEENAIY